MNNVKQAGIRNRFAEVWNMLDKCRAKMVWLIDDINNNSEDICEELDAIRDDLDGVRDNGIDDIGSNLVDKCRVIEKLASEFNVLLEKGCKNKEIEMVTKGAKKRPDWVYNEDERGKKSIIYDLRVRNCNTGADMFYNDVVLSSFAMRRIEAFDALNKDAMQKSVVSMDYDFFTLDSFGIYLHGKSGDRDEWFDKNGEITNVHKDRVKVIVRSEPVCWFLTLATEF